MTLAAPSARGGRLALMAYTREDLEGLWYADYFPSTRAWMAATHPTVADLLAELPWRFCAVGSRSVSRPGPPGLRR